MRRLQDLPQVEGVSYEKALQLIYDEELFISIVEEYAIGAMKQLELLKSKYEALCDEESSIEDSLYQYRVQVHSMKSNAATIGAFKLSEEAKRLEFAARDQMFDEIVENHDVFCEHFKILAELLIACFQEDEAGIEADYEIIGKGLECLIEAAEDMDLDQMDRTAAELKKYSFPESEKGLVKEILEAIAGIDYDACKELAIELKEQIGR